MQKQQEQQKVHKADDSVKADFIKTKKEVISKIQNEILVKEAKQLYKEIKQLKGEKKRLEDMLFKLGKMNTSPCFVCGYKGEGYFDPLKHKCAKRHHQLYKGD